jgi:hypothetical protein
MSRMVSTRGSEPDPQPSGCSDAKGSIEGLDRGDEEESVAVSNIIELRVEEEGE